jgi:hypothetical protein
MIFWNPLLVNSKDEVTFAPLFTLETTRSAGGLQLLRCQGFEVNYYDFTLDALNLKPSDACNVGVYARNHSRDGCTRSENRNNPPPP